MKRRNNKFFDRGPFATGLFVLAMVFALGALFWINSINNNVQEVSYSKVLELIESKKIKDAEISGSQFFAKLKDDQTQIVASIMPTDGFFEKLYQSGANVMLDKEASASWLSYLFLIMLSLLILGAVYLVSLIFKGFQGGGSGGGRFFDVGRSRAKFFPAKTIKTKFTDVAGYSGTKEELKDVVEFLKSPEKFKKIGAKIPRGVLLSGNPGNGKTLLAKAVAGEANCPFLSISGSDFVEVFVGVGAKRVRELFYQARRNAPAIIFIDEIDAVGRERGSGSGGGNDEREQTLNQLLSEMDGFSTEPGEVIVIAATNREDVLDKALLRPGRFDRVVSVPSPDLKTREKILKIHSTGVKFEDDVDFEKIARGTTGFSGAELANLINEAALNAAKQKKARVGKADLDVARDKNLMGHENRSMLRTVEELKETAFHEAGHALVRVLLPDAVPILKVTIVSRGHALGVTMGLPEGDDVIDKYEQLYSEIMVGLGGLVAEKITMKTQTSGVGSDLQGVTRIARSMVRNYGMSELGPVDMGFYNNGRDLVSQGTLEKIDKEVKKLLEKAYKETEELLTKNKEKLYLLANEIYEKETLEASEIYELLGLDEKPARSFFSKSEIDKKREAGEFKAEKDSAQEDSSKKNQEEDSKDETDDKNSVKIS